MHTHGIVGVVICVLFTSQCHLLQADPGTEAELERIARLIGQLGDDEFPVREAASKELEAIGEPALPSLKKAAVADDPEIRRRAEQIVRAIGDRMLAAVAKKEFEGLQGQWHSTSGEVDGVRQSGENKADRHFFSGDQWICKNGDAVLQTATVKIIEVGDKGVKIDFIITAGSYTGYTWSGIYQRDGDVLKWCGGYASAGRARPSTFATRPGDGLFLRTLQRDSK